MKVLVATPTIDGRIDVRFLSSLIATMRSVKPSVLIDIKFILGDSFIGRARDQLLQFAVDASADVLMWIDSDGYWTPADFIRILESKHDYVGGLQRYKTFAPAVPIKLLPGATVDASGVIEVAGIGFGMTKMTSACFKALHDLALPYSSQGASLRNVFETPIVDGELHGEDFSVCKLWRNLGYHIYCDTQVKLGHVGSGITFDFEGLQDPPELETPQ